MRLPAGRQGLRNSECGFGNLKLKTPLEQSAERYLKLNIKRWTPARPFRINPFDSPVWSPKDAFRQAQGPEYSRGAQGWYCTSINSVSWACRWKRRLLPRFKNRGLPSTRAQAEGAPSNVSSLKMKADTFPLFLFASSFILEAPLW